jgi:hypothetical protein
MKIKQTAIFNSFWRKQTLYMSIFQQFRSFDCFSKVILPLWDFKFSRRRVWCSELSSGIYCRVKLLSTDLSEVRTASIIRDEWQYAPLKRLSTIILHGSISQKTTLNIILAAVKTWNLTSRRKLTRKWKWLSPTKYLSCPAGFFSMP